MRSLSLALSTLFLLMGCTEDEAPPLRVASTPESAEEAPAELEARTLMAQHSEHAIAARDALIRGDIESAGAHVSWISEHPYEGALPARMHPMLANMQAAARRFGEARSLTERSEAFALMLSGCGNCHASMHQGPSYEAPELPAGEGIGPHMQRHRWAANRMWEGLVEPSEENFQNALAVLSDEALRPEEVGVGNGSAAQIRAIAEEVHHLAEESIDADDDASKVALYGRFLASCAGCHHLLERGPSESQTSAPE